MCARFTIKNLLYLKELLPTYGYFYNSFQYILKMSQPSRIWLSSPHMGGTEYQYVKDAFDSNWIAPAGPHITTFENNLSKISNALSCFPNSANSIPL